MGGSGGEGGRGWCIIDCGEGCGCHACLEIGYHCNISHVMTRGLDHFIEHNPLMEGGGGGIFLKQ